VEISKKEKVLEELFKICKKKGCFIFDNDLVKYVRVNYA